MILLAHGFTFAVGLAVIILVVVAVTAIWERLRDDRELKKLEREVEAWSGAIRRYPLSQVEIYVPSIPRTKLAENPDPIGGKTVQRSRGSDWPAARTRI